MANRLLRYKLYSLPRYRTPCRFKVVLKHAIRSKYAQMNAHELAKTDAFVFHLLKMRAFIDHMSMHAYIHAHTRLPNDDHL